jgi:hypothetical protein
MEDAVSQIPNFFRCTSPHCESGQIHESTNNQPIVTCIACGHRSCFRHKVAWHETLSCAEYDSFLADPINFRSRFEIENERVEREKENEKAARRFQEDMDRAYAQTLIEADQRAEAERQAERERQTRMETERREQQQREDKRRLEEADKERKRQEVVKKQQDESASQSTVQRTTKPCPNCKRPIEKNGGWYAHFLTSALKFAN